MDESGFGDKTDGQALLAGGQTEAEGDVSFASSTWAKGYDILTPFHPLAACQLQNLHFVQRRDGFEVEAVQAFDRRELRGLDPVARQGIAQQWPERGCSIIRRSRSNIVCGVPDPLISPVSTA
jgi:hypothetical protein